MTYQESQQIAIEADRQWQEALKARFKTEAGDARYDKRGESTEELARLKQAYRAASDAAYAIWVSTLIYQEGR